MSAPSYLSLEAFKESFRTKCNRGEMGACEVPRLIRNAIAGNLAFTLSTEWRQVVRAIVAQGKRLPDSQCALCDRICQLAFEDLANIPSPGVRRNWAIEFPTHQ